MISADVASAIEQAQSKKEEGNAALAASNPGRASFHYKCALLFTKDFVKEFLPTVGGEGGEASSSGGMAEMFSAGRQKRKQGSDKTPEDAAATTRAVCEAHGIISSNLASVLLRLGRFPQARAAASDAVILLRRVHDGSDRVRTAAPAAVNALTTSGENSITSSEQSSLLPPPVLRRALYRRGVALTHLGLLDEARADLVAAGPDDDAAVSAALRDVAERERTAAEKEKKMFAKMFA